MAAVHKYPDEESELWACLIEMLKWSLNVQNSPSKLIPMDSFEFSRLIFSLSLRRESDLELWGLLAKVLVTLMNTKKLGVIDLMEVTRALVNAKVRSDKMYGFIVKYFMAIGFKEERWATVNPSVPIFFFFSLAKAYPVLNLSDNPEFFELTNNYLKAQIERLNLTQTEICL